jgi:secreted trypsin-like serine protease
MQDVKLSAVKLSLFAALVATLGGCAVDSTDADTDLTDVEASSDAIVGGQPTSGYAAVGALTRDGAPFCTGTVVTKRAVVTAAHCLAGQSASRIRFALGPSARSPQASVAVSRIVVHPSWDPRAIKNDIGVVILAQDAPVTPVAVNSSMSSSWVGRSLEFVGYGATNGYTGGGSGTKRVVSIPISEVGSTQFAYVDDTRNTCFGDSGGPAFARDENNNLVLVGVTSYGDRTCTQFGVDTRVDAYRSFISSAIQP